MARPDKRRQIMDVAERLFTTRRFHEITTDDIAAAAGVGKGTIYRYFKDKDDLFFQTATAGFDELCELVRRCTADSAGFHEQLLGACEQIREFFTSHMPLFRMMNSEESRFLVAKGMIHEQWTAHRKNLVAAVAAVVKRGVAEGQMRSDMPPEIMANFLLGMLRTQARDLGDVPPSSRRPDVVVDLFCHGAKQNHQRAGTSVRPRAARRPA
jgi:AcrR family transcriptional regulator